MKRKWIVRLSLLVAIVAALWFTRAQTFVVDLVPEMEAERIRQQRPPLLDYSLKLFCRRAIVSAHVHCIGPGQTCPIHHHLDRWELTQILRGVGRLRTVTVTTDLQVSDYYIAPPKAAHEMCNPGKEPLWCLVVATPPFKENLYLAEEKVNKDILLSVYRPRLKQKQSEEAIKLGNSIVGRVMATNSSSASVTNYQRFVSLTNSKGGPKFSFVKAQEALPDLGNNGCLLEVRVPTYWEWFVSSGGDESKTAGKMNTETSDT